MELEFILTDNKWCTVDKEKLHEEFGVFINNGKEKIYAKQEAGKEDFDYLISCITADNDIISLINDIKDDALAFIDSDKAKCAKKVQYSHYEEITGDDYFFINMYFENEDAEKNTYYYDAYNECECEIRNGEWIPVE